MALLLSPGQKNGTSFFIRPLLLVLFRLCLAVDSPQVKTALPVYQNGNMFPFYGFLQSLFLQKTLF